MSTHTELNEHGEQITLIAEGTDALVAAAAKPKRARSPRKRAPAAEHAGLAHDQRGARSVKRHLRQQRVVLAVGFLQVLRAARFRLQPLQQLGRGGIGVDDGAARSGGNDKVAHAVVNGPGHARHLQQVLRAVPHLALTPARDVATIALANAQAHLRNGLAMGANRALHVVTDNAVQPLTAARVLLKLVEKEQPGLVLLGKQAIDDDANQTGQMLATLWGRPQATFASKLDIADGKATVVREVDAGLETLEVDLPAVITTDLRLNEPRFIKLPDIMKAKSKPLETLPLESLGVKLADTLTMTHYAPPAKRSKGVMVPDAASLVAALKEKGLV